ncbi:MAG: 3-dehydroquinate synthase [Bacteroidales bacterium]|nr:3-dehydroquinate synthase [Bacteroidales bacterium]
MIKERQKIDAIDAEMARLFKERMEAVHEIALEKKASGAPVEDLQREKEMIERRCAAIENEQLRGHYADFLRGVIGVSKDYQNDIIAGCEMPGHQIIIERDALAKAGSLLGIPGGKVMIVTDSGVPVKYPQAVENSLKAAGCEVFTVTIPQGEASKNLDSYRTVMEALVSCGFTRTDTVVAVGGGVPGDLAGFVAATFMRGIRFCNIPTTLLSQVDSSVGGKTAIDFGRVKNIVGAFHMPLKVLIDPDTLASLPQRQLHNGLVEAIKVGATGDAELFALIERSDDLLADAGEIIRRSVNYKQAVVKADPREKDLRRVLNFGHTVGHAIEALGCGRYLHGEAVAMGMMYFCSGATRERIASVLAKYNLPVRHDIDPEAIRSLIAHDKKASGGDITVVKVDTIGSYRFEKVNIQDLAL